MAAACQPLNESVFAEPRVHAEYGPSNDASGNYAVYYTRPRRRADEEQQDDGQQYGCESDGKNEQVHCSKPLELYALAGSLVYGVLHRLKGRRNGGLSPQQSGRCRRRTTRRLSWTCPGRRWRTCCRSLCRLRDQAPRRWRSIAWSPGRSTRS